jgi:hypothetical protein
MPVCPARLAVRRALALDLRSAATSLPLVDLNESTVHGPPAQPSRRGAIESIYMGLRITAIEQTGRGPGCEHDNQA